MPGKLLRVFALLTTVSLLANCQFLSEEEDVDRSILTGVPCAAPCWQGIVPGETTAGEAFEILTQLGYNPHRGEWGSYIGWYSPAGHTERELRRGANSLDSFQVAGPIAYLRVGLEFDLSAKEMVARFGLPEKYQVYETVDTLAAGGHTPILIGRFYYPQQGLTFELRVPVFVPPNQTQTIDSTAKLDWIYYFSPTSTDNLWKDNPRLEKVIDNQQLLQDWEGFPIEYQRAGS